MEGTGTNGAHEPKGRTKYKYITLAEAYDSFPGAEVNFYGIVAEWTVPRPTRKGTDMYQVLKLRDASVTDITSDGDGGHYSDIQVQFFASSREELPKPRKKGDIIRLHRVKVGRWDGKPQLNAKIGTIMQGGMAGGFSRCQYCLFDAKVAEGVENAGFEPYQRSSVGFTFDVQNDKARIQGLRDYLARIGGEMALVDDTFSIPLTRITMLKNYDLHVLVLDVVRDKGKVTLVVWDGSDARPFIPGLNLNDGGPGDGHGCHYWMPCAQDFPVEAGAFAGDDVPGLGTAFPVLLRQFDIEIEDLPAKGQWIRLRQLSSWVKNGQLQGLFVQSSKWAPAEPNHAWLTASKTRDERRQVSLWANEQVGATTNGANNNGANNVQGQGVGVYEMPRQVPFGVTRTMHENQPLRSIREILMAPAPNRHRCLVRIIQHYPKDTHDLCAERDDEVATKPKRRKGVNEPKAASKGKNDPLDKKWEWNLSFLIEDATGKMTVNVAPEDGREFFPHIEPCDLWDNESAFVKVEKTMRALTVKEDRAPGEGWVQMCVMSYVGEDGRRFHRLFGTRVL